jgi:hypothetical protein
MCERESLFFATRNIGRMRLRACLIIQASSIDGEGRCDRRRTFALFARDRRRPHRTGLPIIKDQTDPSKRVILLSILIC